MNDVVQIVLSSNDKVLLGFRTNTDAYSQLWGFPSGRVEFGETLLVAAKREAFEELSVIINELEFVCNLVDDVYQVRHHFYICRNWTGDISNKEPRLCSKLNWFSLKNLPENCTPLTILVQDVMVEHLQRKMPGEIFTLKPVNKD